MKIILLKDAPKIGKRGELREVPEGHARNFLIPKGFAKLATANVQNTIQKEQKEATAKQEREQARLEKIQKTLASTTIHIQVKHGEKGQIYSGIREADIAFAIADKTGIHLEKQQIHLTRPIKEVGDHKVELRLGKGLKTIIKLQIQA